MVLISRFGELGRQAKEIEEPRIAEMRELRNVRRTLFCPL